MTNSIDINFRLNEVVSDGVVEEVVNEGFAYLDGELPEHVWPNIYSEFEKFPLIGDLWEQGDLSGSENGAAASRIENIKPATLERLSPTLGGLSLDLIEIARPHFELDAEPRVSMIHYYRQKVVTPIHEDPHRGLVGIIADNNNATLTLYGDNNQEIASFNPGPRDIVVMRGDLPHSVVKPEGDTRLVANLHAK